MPVSYNEQLLFGTAFDLPLHWNLGARKNMFHYPGIYGMVELLAHPDGVEQKEPIGFQTSFYHSHVGPIIGRSHMFEHPNRGDAIKLFIDIAIILQSNLNWKTTVPFSAECSLLFRDSQAHNFCPIFGSGAMRKPDTVTFMVGRIAIFC